jgi:hypothetical protein
LTIAIALVVLAFAAPHAVPLANQSGLPMDPDANLSGSLVLGVPQLMLLLAMAIAGRPGFNYVRALFSGVFTKSGPPEAVSRTRYRIGLALFIVPALLSFLGPYAASSLPDDLSRPMLGLAGDLLVVVSLLVLGGGFWDKLRALLRYDATIVRTNLRVQTADVTTDAQAESSNTEEAVNIGLRFKLGVIIFALGFLIWLCVPIATAMGLPSNRITAMVGVIFVCNKLLILTAGAVMGKSGFNHLKRMLGSWIKPAHTVGPTRYRIGLAMFLTSVVLGWLSPYVMPHLQFDESLRYPAAIAGDLLLVSSLFVLGGEFWGKLRALFVYDAKAVIPG